MPPIADTAPAVALIGPTAVGKTALSLALAERFDCEIVSVDSMQLYRFMDIGTAKATPAERAQVPHHLIDIVDPDEPYSLARFVSDAAAAVGRIRQRRRLPLLAGGTGLYFRGLCEGVFEHTAIDPGIRRALRRTLEAEGSAPLLEELERVDPVSARRIHPNDRQRLLRALEIFRATGVPWSRHLAASRQRPVLENVLKLGLTCDREELYQRIELRCERMIEEGLLDEVRGLLARGYHGGLKPMQAIGYRHMVNFLEGRWRWDEALVLLARDTRRYAKRQFTWFRRDPEILWLRPAEETKIAAAIERFLEQTASQRAGHRP